MRKKIFIVGTGGLAKEIAFIIDSISNFILEGFISNEIKEGEKIFKDYKVKGNDENALKFYNNESFFIAIGDLKRRQKVFKRYKTGGVRKFPSIISPKSVSAKDIVIGEGSIIYPASVVMPNVSIGRFSIINANVFVGHDSMIGEFTNINPGAIVNGEVSIGNHVTIGARVVLHQGVNICNNVIIGMGSVVVRDIKEKGTYFGNPAKKIF